MLVEPCGGSNCVSIIRSSYSEKIEPTEKYNFDQCGIVNKRGYSLVNKALKLKVSTNLNILRPAEYPWLVSLFDHRKV